MKQAMTATAPGAVWLSRLLLAVAVALVMGTSLADTVDATKKGKNTVASIKDRVRAQRDACEMIGGGTLDVRELPSGTKITYCEGGTYGGTRCKHTSEATTCTCTETGTPGWCPPTNTGAPSSGVANPPTGGVAQESADGTRGKTSGHGDKPGDRSGRRSR